MVYYPYLFVKHFTNPVIFEVYFMSSIGKRLIKLRNQRGLKQNQIAKELGISNANLSRYEQDKRTPNEKTIHLLADFYEVTPSYLLFGEEDQLSFLSDITKEEATLLKEYLEKIRKQP